MKKKPIPLAQIVAICLLSGFFCSCGFFKSESTETVADDNIKTWEQYYSSPSPEVYNLLVETKDLERTLYKVTGIVYDVYSSDEKVSLVYINTHDDLKWIFITDDLEGFIVTNGNTITGYGAYMWSMTRPMPSLILTRCINGDLNYVDSVFAIAMER